MARLRMSRWLQHCAPLVLRHPGPCPFQAAAPLENCEDHVNQPDIRHPASSWPLIGNLVCDGAAANFDLNSEITTRAINLCYVELVIVVGIKSFFWLVKGSSVLSLHAAQGSITLYGAVATRLVFFPGKHTRPHSAYWLFDFLIQCPFPPLLPRVQGLVSLASPYKAIRFHAPSNFFRTPFLSFSHAYFLPR